MNDNNLSGMVARIDDLEQRHEHDQAALRSMAQQLQEERAAKESALRRADLLNRDLRMVQEVRDYWRAECQKMIADRTYVTA